MSMTGTWSFLSQSGTSGTSPTTYKPGTAVEMLRNYKHGDLIEADFLNAKDACSFSLTSWQINGPLGLCYYADPESPCADGDPFERSH